jgi:nitroreductase
MPEERPEVTAPNTYDALMETLLWRRSIRGFKPDPVSDEDLYKIIDAAHYAMSGANSQPWEFIIVKDPETKQKLREVYEHDDYQFTYWLEQQRDPEFPHPYFNFPPEEIEQQMQKQYQRTREMIRENRAALDALTDRLVQHKSMDQTQLEAFFKEMNI